MQKKIMQYQEHLRLKLSQMKIKKIVFFCSLDGEYGNSLEELQRLSGTKIIENEKKRINEQVKKSGLIDFKKLPKKKRKNKVTLT